MQRVVMYVPALCS